VSSPLAPLLPTDTRPFFRPLSAALSRLLAELPHSAWERPTVAGAWRVRDVAAHLLDVTLRRLSFHRDHHAPPAPSAPPRSEREFTVFINALNRQWVDSSARLSPRVLTELLTAAGTALADFVEALPDDAPALFPVSWAGEHESAGWFDIGREFTEQWHHQAQIRDAVGASPLPESSWLRAVLEIALRGLPHAYRHVAAPAGATVRIDVTGRSGGVWTLRFDPPAWTLWSGAAGSESSRVELSDDTAWRLLFNALPAAQVPHVVIAEGHASLTEPLTRARSVIV
jgi:uncharacterized protein (TIGR03083 family)